MVPLLLYFLSATLPSWSPPQNVRSAIYFPVCAFFLELQGGEKKIESEKCTKVKKGENNTHIPPKKGQIKDKEKISSLSYVRNHGAWMVLSTLSPFFPAGWRLRENRSVVLFDSPGDPPFPPPEYICHTSSS